MNNLLKMDMQRYADGRMPMFQRFFRLAQKGGICKLVFKPLFVLERNKRCIDLSIETKIGGGCYFGHASGITINPHAMIGSNVNIHKGVTIGRENRGSRKGVPVIGNDVWIGINAVIVGNVKIGNDVMIAPNSFVNFDIPDHSIVIGNPSAVKSKMFATEGYINHRISISNENMKEL